MFQLPNSIVMPSQAYHGQHEAGSDKRFKSIMCFMTLQIFVMIYFQKIALLQVSLPLIVMLVHIVWVLMWGTIRFSALKLACYLFFVSCCLFSQVIGGTSGSMFSFLQLILLYLSMTLTTDLPDANYRRIIDRFVKFMILPSLIVIFQYFWQKLSGRPDFIDMDAMFPKSILLQGFWYNAHYPLWTSPFTRPNGFFFLEPSTVSLYTAAAAICEITYFMRRWIVVLLIAATIFSTGVTGLTVLTVAVPFLLIRKAKPQSIVMLIIVALLTLGVAMTMGVEIPLLSRMNELDHDTDSGGQRMTVPATQLIARVMDPGYLFTGAGPGSTGADLGNPWPILKLTNEYGLLAMLSFVVFYLVVLRSNSSDLPLKLALSIIFQFTGGYLVDPFIVNFLALLCLAQPRRRPPPTVALVASS